MTYTMSHKKDTILINTTTGTITGGTYGMKEIIKEEFDGIRWDGTRKCWAMDSAALESIVTNRNEYLTRCYKLSVNETAPSKQTETRVHNGLCPHCGTYCYGDCRAS